MRMRMTTLLEIVIQKKAMMMTMMMMMTTRMKRWKKSSLYLEPVAHPGYLSCDSALFGSCTSMIEIDSHSVS